MFVLQANIGDDLNQNQLDLSSTDYIVFSNGYNASSSSSTGMRRILETFDEIDTIYAKTCYIMRDTTVFQVNYSGASLHNAQSLFYAHPDQSTNFNKFSFRILFLDNYIDWIKTPRCYTKVPNFFYGYAAIDTLITPFFYTMETSINTNDLIEIDGYLCIVTKAEMVGPVYKKVYIIPYDITSSFLITKEKYIIRDYNIPMTSSEYSNMVKVLFHDEDISLDQIPNVDFSSDVTDLDDRNFRTLYEWFNLDISSSPFYINIDSTVDLSTVMLIGDFALTNNINTGDSVIYFTTAQFNDIKKGDQIMVKNNVYSEMMRVSSTNPTNHSVAVSRPFTKYEFLSSDSDVKCYFSRILHFQPIVLNDGEHSINYPIQFTMEINYLNL